MRLFKLILISLSLVVLFVLTNIYIDNKLKLNQELKVKQELIEKNKRETVKVETISSLEFLMSLNPEIYKKYILKTLNKTEEASINKFMNLEIDKYTQYFSSDIPENVIRDSVKSAILYHLSFKNTDKKLFKKEKRIQKRIYLTTCLLLSVAKIETGYVFNYDHREFSRTGAYGRYQIVATTSASIIMDLLIKEGLKITDIEISKQKTFYDNYVNFAKEENDIYKMLYSEDWSLRYQNIQANKYFKYVKKLNSNYLEVLDGRLGHIYKTCNGIKVNDLKKQIFYYKGNVSTFKKYKFSTQVLTFLQEPVNQGILASFVLQEIYNREAKKNKPNLVYRTLKMYNNDRTIRNGKETRLEYASHGNLLFDKLVSIY